MKTHKKETQKIFGYARVSTREQNEARQVLALAEAGVPQSNIFIDKMSGKDFERPEYKKLLGKLKLGSTLFVKSIDRLGRSYKDISEQWRVITKEIGADIVVIDMPPLDTRKEKNLLGNLISDLILTLLSFVAESEYRSIHERQAEGIAVAKARGVKFGRPPAPLPENFAGIYEEWKERRIGSSEAAMALAMPISTFTYRAKKFEEKKNKRNKR